MAIINPASSFNPIFKSELWNNCLKIHKNSNWSACLTFSLCYPTLWDTAWTRGAYLFLRNWIAKIVFVQSINSEADINWFQYWSLQTGRATEATKVSLLPPRCYNHHCTLSLVLIRSKEGLLVSYFELLWTAKIELYFIDSSRHVVCQKSVTSLEK